MPDRDHRRRIVSVEVPWRTLFKLLAAAALVWCWFQLVQVVLLLVVAVLLAVTLDPLVCWLERRRLPRWAASTLIIVALVVVIGGFLWISWTTLTDQSQYLAQRFTAVEQQMTKWLPSWMQPTIDGQSDARSLLSRYALQVAQSATSALTLTALGLILTVYLLVEGRRTYEWLIAFVPHHHRPRTMRTLDECRRVIFAYVAGNAITSVIATVCTLAALLALQVPAALLLALMAGVSDFVPVIGFIASSIPALVLAMTVSTKTMVLVALVYVVYNGVEAYLISPWAYGNRMRLSNVAVVLAFVVGAELAGVIGALIALPIAAIYPSVEKIWLRDELPEETVREHRALESRKAG